MPRLAFTIADTIRRAASITRRVIGAPDYERYLTHTRACHPNRVPMTRAEFERERMAARYEKVGGRCC